MLKAFFWTKKWALDDDGMEKLLNIVRYGEKRSIAFEDYLTRVIHFMKYGGTLKEAENLGICYSQLSLKSKIMKLEAEILRLKIEMLKMKKGE